MTSEFESILNWGGSPQAQCGCGRVHFTDSGDHMEPGELDGLRAKAKENPDLYIADGENHSVSMTEVNGVVAVWGCKCGYLERVESFLWNNRGKFLTYYRTRIEREKKEAEAVADQLPTRTKEPKSMPKKIKTAKRWFVRWVLPTGTIRCDIADTRSELSRYVLHACEHGKGIVTIEIK